MIVLLGASGYIGQAFQRGLQRRGWRFESVSRAQVKYDNYHTLVAYLRCQRPQFVINAAGFTGKPNVDACEAAQAETLAGNVCLPLTISHACQSAGIPWGHVSSGCIYSGAVVEHGSGRRIEANLMAPHLQPWLAEQPQRIHGFNEGDQPNFSFRQPPCSFYSGSKALGEEALAGDEQVFVWRLRMPFSERDEPRNYLSKLLRYPKLYDNINSISHADEFVDACLELWRLRAPFGTYNITNPGFVRTRQITGWIEARLKPQRKFEFWEDDAEFYRCAARAWRSNCVLDGSKLAACGVCLRPIEDAICHALEHWQSSRICWAAARPPRTH